MKMRFQGPIMRSITRRRPFFANLKDDRESGDYEVFSYIDKETAEAAITEAKEFLKETKRYLKDSGILADETQETAKGKGQKAKGEIVIR